MKKCGKIIDVVNKKILEGCIYIENGLIKDIKREQVNTGEYIMPGFVDAHVHIESSMLIPSRFSILAIKQGTVAVVSDPHEIANVLGEEGLFFMLNDAEKTPLKIYFGIPSCVPATPFETSGAVITSKDIERLFATGKFHFLSEMMNFPGVIFGDKEVLAKLEVAKKYNKIIDGHAPGLRGEDLDKYIKAGIKTDHEAYSYDEAKEKIEKGMKILIREGSAAKNFDALYKLIDQHPEDVMLCTDDSHPDDLVEGHINKILAKGVAKGLDLFNLLRAATFNPVKFYNLNVGLLQPGDPADFITVKNLTDFEVTSVYIDGKPVYQNGQYNYNLPETTPINKFYAEKIKEEDLRIEHVYGKKIKVIKAFDGELITDVEIVEPRVAGNYVVTDPSRDILKIVVYNRYQKSQPAVAFITGFGLKKGAIAQTIAHDSHNIVAVGVSDTEIVDAINALIEAKGGIVVNDGMGNILKLALPYAGLMSDENPFELADTYKKANELAYGLGSKLRAPFMTLAFMPLLVIPKLKLGDKGLFDVTKFEFTDLFTD